MRRFLISAFGLIITGVLMSGCSSLFGTEYKYSVQAENIGRSKIKSTKTLDLYDPEKGFSKIPFGELNPGQSGTASTFLYVPYNEINFTWLNLETNEMVSVKVPVKLPKEFEKPKGHRIIFRIDPENKKVYVSYELYKSEKGLDTYEVDSDGKPVQPGSFTTPPEISPNTKQ